MTAPTAIEAARRADKIIDDVRVGLGEKSMPPPLPARERRIPVSAPVNREAHSLSGERTSMTNRITLSPEEKEVARKSFTAPDTTDEQKYLRDALPSDKGSTYAVTTTFTAPGIVWTRRWSFHTP